MADTPTNNPAPAEEVTPMETLTPMDEGVTGIQTEVVNDVITDPIKPYTNDVYAATPSSGSGGGEEEDEPLQRGTEPTKVSISDFMQATSNDDSSSKSAIVDEWVSQATTYNAENPPVEKGDESFESPVKPESMKSNDTPAVKDENQELEDENLPTTFKIFVSNLPPGLFNSELMELFDQYGEVVACEIFAKNYAFVHMTSEESGMNALEALNGFELRGCRINVKRSVNTTGTPGVKQKKEEKPQEAIIPGVEIGTFKLFLGNLNDDVTKESVAKLLEPYGRTVEIEIFRKTSAFVHMETEEGAKKAIEELNGKTLPDCEKPMVVSESKNPEGPTLPTIKLMVRNLASDVSAEEVRDLFSPYGLVLKVVLSSKPSSSPHRTAVVHLEQFGNIRSAINDLTGKEVGGSEIKVEATFDKPAPVKPKPNLSSTSTTSTRSPPKKQDPYGGWVPVESSSSFRPTSYTRTHSSERALPNKMRLIPMPSKSDLQKFPRAGTGGGRRLLNPQVRPPPLMNFPSRPTWEGNDSYNDYDYSYSQAHDGYGGGYSNYGEEETDEYSEYEVYDWSQQGNDYEAPPMKIPRNSAWNSSPNFGGRPSNPPNFGGRPNNPQTFGGRPSNPQTFGGRPSNPQNFGGRPSNPQNFGGRPSNQNGRKGWDKQKNKNNNNNSKNKNSPFPQLPTADRFPAARPPPSLMSFQTSNPENNDWSADLPLSNFSADFASGQDFSNDESTTYSTNAVPFDYSKMKKKNNSAQNWNWNSNPGPNSFGNSQGQGKSGKSGKGRKGKGKARHPGLGTAQQQKKAAQHTGNDEAYSDASSANQGGWPSAGSSASTSEPSNAYAPYYSQQNFSFSKGNKQGNKRPTPKQMKEAEEEQKRQYADFLKQKPWLYQAIPGTVKKVQQ